MQKPNLQEVLAFVLEQRRVLADKPDAPLEFPPQDWPMRLALESLRMMGCVGFPSPPSEPASIEDVRRWLDELLAWGEHSTQPTETAPPKLLTESLADVLSKSQLAIITRLQQSSASYDALRGTPDCFRDGVTDEAITRALERLRDRLNQYPEWGVTLTVSTAKKRASLQVQSDKTTDK